MSQRKLYLDEAPGERRGVVMLDGQPERLFIERYDDIAVQQAGAWVVARVRKIERTLKSAFLDLGEGPDAVLPLTGDAEAIAEGAWVEVEIVTAARGDKGAVARLRGPSESPHRLIAAAPHMGSRLLACAEGTVITGGDDARAAADRAEEAALSIQYALSGGGRLFIEPTQALIAIDVDLASATGDSRKATVRANQEAIAAAARLLRLKGLGGLVAIDLAGKGHDGPTFSALAKAAFAPDGAGVSIGPISRFGVFELSLPRTGVPVSERLLDRDGRPSAVTVALRLLRAIEAAAGPGQQVKAVCAPDVAVIARRLSGRLTDRIGARFTLQADPAKARADVEITAE
jgi:Ribonuclease G/E